ncbi:hypothetical protein [Pseudohoeflea coraliihabitans]|uniref:DUF4169 family protein n=1 Tax=Pseudohoeflea coraliihabitans TaxID=2860393 RepID=A0ABS6WN99_9HYPH|nr:hypothetical protein [Pseudohoeflea sp. DP4N28-3]MBW3097434.1 hypothetical protein [Pseudohoeflea sp. DP4N28-3]
MTDDPKNDRQQRRAARLAAELRANLQRRKQQSRARREGLADETDGLPAADTTSGDHPHKPGDSS